MICKIITNAYTVSRDNEYVVFQAFEEVAEGMGEFGCSIDLRPPLSDAIGLFSNE
jgi:hypothetical protein